MLSPESESYRRALGAGADYAEGSRILAERVTDAERLRLALEAQERALVRAEERLGL